MLHHPLCTRGPLESHVGEHLQPSLVMRHGVRPATWTVFWSQAAAVDGVRCNSGYSGLIRQLLGFEPELPSQEFQDFAGMLPSEVPSQVSSMTSAEMLDFGSLASSACH